MLSLSPQQQAILTLVEAGLRRCQVAERLGVNESTVGTQLSRIKRKLIAAGWLAPAPHTYTPAIQLAVIWRCKEMPQDGPHL